MINSRNLSSFILSIISVIIYLPLLGLMTYMNNHGNLIGFHSNFWGMFTASDVSPVPKIIFLNVLSFITALTSISLGLLFLKKDLKNRKIDFIVISAIIISTINITMVFYFLMLSWPVLFK